MIYAVFDTGVTPHTSPTFPAIVNVYVTPGFIANPARLHKYCVPLARLVTAGAAHPPGWSATTFTIDAETVSTTVRLVSVAAPAFVTTTRYVIASPTPGFAGTCCFTTDTFVTGGFTHPPTAFEKLSITAHAVPAITYAVFVTIVGAHTSPIRPVIVNV
jgi:hypothetical protein